MLIFILFVIIVLVILLFIFENWSVRNYPPGPWRFPIIGTLPQIALADPIYHIALDKLSRKYGDIMSIKMGVIDAIILSSFEHVKHILHKEETFGRYANGVLLERIKYDQSKSLAFSNGEHWEKMRTYCQNTLKIYGYGNRIYTETLMNDSLESFLLSLEKDRSSSLNGLIHFKTSYFYPAFVNVIFTLLTGKKHTDHDGKLKLFMHTIDQFMRSSEIGEGIGNAFPILNKVFSKFMEYEKQQERVKIILELSQSYLESVRNTNYDSPSCFVEHFNSMIKKDSESEVPFYTDEQFCLVFSDLLIAGFETSSNTVNFLILLLASHPDVQDKVYEEINKFIGTHERPSLKDRQRMVYTQATILESARWSRTVVFLVPRLVLKDFNYNGYEIRKGTAILTNLHSIFFNKNLWGDPEIFRPERFVDAEGKLSRIHSERIIPFGTGKRNCFGETLSKDGIFLFITTLLQKYKFELPEEMEKPSLEPTIGFTLGPQPYFANVNLR